MSNNQKVECSFSLLETGRKYTGNHRKYVIENARDICYSPSCRESIKLREALGYYGHGRRVLAGRQDLSVGEISVITMPNGETAMVSNVPSNITVQFDVDPDGTVRHTQEILDTETGKIVAGLHTSHVGGWSWACPGKDGKESRPTLITGFSGFDYVLQPGFSANRGYVLESAKGDAILESVAAVVGNSERAEQLVAGWRMDMDSRNRLSEMENTIFESETKYADAIIEMRSLRSSLEQAESGMTDVKRALAEEKQHFRGILENIAENLPFFIPEQVMHELLEGDFTRARGIFESARRFDFTQLPIANKGPGRSDSLHVVAAARPEPPQYGTAAYGFSIDL